MLLERHLDALASRAMQRALDLDDAPPAVLRPTTDPRFGDYQVNGAMPLAKKLGKAPRELAGPIADALQQEDAVAKAEVAGPGFVNLTLDIDWLAARLRDALTDPRNGVPVVERPEKVVVDFSSPNIAKQMHVGHLRSTIIGAALVEILRYLGHDVIGDNHLGDWGTQFGLLIVGMREWGDERSLSDHPVTELEHLYKLASAKAKEDDAFADKARQELAKLQAGDEENLALWKRFVAVTRKSLDEVYAKLGVTFDEWLGESAYHDLLPGVVQTLRDKGIAREDAGAICVFFSEIDGAPKKLKKQSPFIVQKKDGAFLYSTTDVATILYRKDRFGTERAIYVVDSRQSQHFEQLFAVADLLGIDMRFDHVGFGTVLDTTGKPIKTRDGKAVTLMSLLAEAEKRAAVVLDEQQEAGKLRIDEGDRDRVAQAVGIGAVKYADLRQNRSSDYQFDLDKMITFEGNSGPYLQNAYVRCRSIFRTLEVEWDNFDAPLLLKEESEIALGRVLARFADVVHRAGETLLPHVIAEHIYEAASVFSRFYHDCSVKNAEGDTRASRLALVKLTGQQLERGLRLLGIEPLDKM